jgi:hypothetical protein
MAIQLQHCWRGVVYLHQILAFVNDEGTNLTTMATTLHYMIDCECLKILRVYDSTCFGHVMFKAY